MYLYTKLLGKKSHEYEMDYGDEHETLLVETESIQHFYEDNDHVLMDIIYLVLQNGINYMKDGVNE